MNQIINETISAILQIVVFVLIPFLFFVIKNKKVNGFLSYIGLTLTTKKAILLSIITSLVFLIGALALILIDSSIREVMITPPSVTGKLRQMGLRPESIIVLLIIACFKTSFAEEIFFRGFLAKRLMNLLGYIKGNILQSLIFALLHVFLFYAFTKSGIPFLIFIFCFSGYAAFLIGYVNEKIGNGSIIPGWIAHGLGNTLSYLIIAFLI